MPNLRTLALPQVVPQQIYRPLQKNIPQTHAARGDLRAKITAYVDTARLVMPLSLNELRVHAQRLLQQCELPDSYIEYTAILVNNAGWREILAGIPYERRLLLLPKCLRVEEKCPAPFDEFGLLCKECGLCSLHDLTLEAEKLGYACLVAEGSTLVMKIIETGKIDAIVGVSCLSVLERAFPFMAAAAIPGVAIPLLQDDCHSTTVDLDWVWEIIHLSREDKTHRLNLEHLREEVSGWFSPAALDKMLGEATTETERIARKWLGKKGKRWRPFLTACMFKALQDEPLKPLPPDLIRTALAVECFHKASLIHDDIADGDAVRYGEESLPAAYGVPVALNIGDWLLGEGYRLLAELETTADCRGQMVAVAAAGHRTLCNGQGAELLWTRTPYPLTSLEVLDIFRQKTAPAFAVALLLGARLAAADEELCRGLEKYSDAVGIAYQIRDDLDDFRGGGDSDDLASARPNLLLALGYENVGTANREKLALLWQGATVAGETAEAKQNAEKLRKLLRQTNSDRQAEALLTRYREEAIRSLQYLDNANVKGLLRRVVGKIFGVQEMEGWCREHPLRNVAGAAAGTENSG